MKKISLEQPISWSTSACERQRTSLSQSYNNLSAVFDYDVEHVGPVIVVGCNKLFEMFSHGLSANSKETQKPK